MSIVEKLFHQAEHLPEDERYALARRLLESAERDSSVEEVERIWDTEIRKRIARYDRGESNTHTAESVIAELDNRLDS